MNEKYLLAFIPVFVAIDPLGLVAIYLGLGANSTPARRKDQAVLGIFSGLVIAIGFIFLGKLIFKAVGITVADFQVAGGLVLLGLAARDLLDMHGHSRFTGDDFGVVPLGLPLIAGPALLTALLILVDTVGIGYTLVSLFLNLFLVWIGFCNAERLRKMLGRQGLAGVSKLTSLLLAAIAVSLIRRGWQSP